MNNDRRSKHRTRTLGDVDLLQFVPLNIPNNISVYTTTASKTSSDTNVNALHDRKIPDNKHIKRNKQRSSSQPDLGNIVKSSTAPSSSSKSSSKKCLYFERKVYPGKGYYEGTFIEGGYRHGQGRFMSPDGRSVLYNGEWQLDKPHNYGSKVFSDHSTYHGNFVNGILHGFGIYRFGTISTHHLSISTFLI